MLTSLRLSSFRCYNTLRWEIPAEGAVLLGSNAQGKTSLLEALCMALALHSPRASRLDRLAAHGAGRFGISLDTEEGNRRLFWQQGSRISLQVNGAERRDYADYLADSYPLTWLDNADRALVNGAAEERRKFLDFLGAQWHPAYRESLQAYRKALRSRNALLRHPRRTRAALQSYAELLARHGEVLMQLRRQLLALLQPHVLHRHRCISGGQESVSLTYAPCTTAPLAEELAASVEADERAGFTTRGPHRDDFTLLIGGMAAAEYASEGQQRTLATALLLAQSSLLQEETGRPPVLLIDDVFGELDPARRRALLDALPAESQTFITTTHLDWLRDTPAPLPVLTVSQGSITPA